MFVITRRAMLKNVVGAVTLCALSASPHMEAEVTTQTPIATAITEVFGEGQKFIAVALEYSKPVRGSSLAPEMFQVQGRTIIAVYTSSSLARHRTTQGRFVILELSPDDKNALLLASPAGGNGGPHTGGPGPDGPGPGGPPPAGPRGPNGGGPGRGRRDFPSPTLKSAEATITQVRSLQTTDGGVLPPPGKPIFTSGSQNPIVDAFKQLTYEAPDGGKLAYNLFGPHDYDPTKQYALVLFVHDAGTLSTNSLVTLAQGLGAVVWASPKDQVKRPCFVVAPQFANVAEGEKTGPGSSMDLVHGLLLALAKQYSIDANRLYSTGQSMGATLSIGMNIAYPHFFAASYLVAGQWDAEQAAPLAKDKLWIVVSQGDERAHPSENAMAAVWEKEGAHISRAVCTVAPALPSLQQTLQR